MNLRPETARALIAAGRDLEERDASSGLTLTKPSHLGSRHDRKVYVGHKHVGWVSQDVDGWHASLVSHVGQRVQQKYVSGPHRMRDTAERHVKEAAAKLGAPTKYKPYGPIEEHLHLEIHLKDGRVHHRLMHERGHAQHVKRQVEKMDNVDKVFLREGTEIRESWLKWDADRHGEGDLSAHLAKMGKGKSVTLRGSGVKVEKYGPAAYMVKRGDGSHVGQFGAGPDTEMEAAHHAMRVHRESRDPKPSPKRMSWDQRMAWQKEAEGHHVGEAAMRICECGAPAKGPVCQRGHRLQEAKATGEKPTKYDSMSKDDLAEAIKKLKGNPDASGVEVAKANQAWARRFAGSQLEEAMHGRWVAGHKRGKALHVFDGQGKHLGTADKVKGADRVKAPPHIFGDLDSAASNVRSHLQESKQTAALSVTHAPIGKGGTNWVTRSKPGNKGQLPAYIQNIRNAIMRDGKDESTATALAVGAVKRWASGRGGVSAEVKAAAAKAVAEWEATKAAGKAGDKAARTAKKAA